jgi:hypothetical protein
MPFHETAAHVMQKIGMFLSSRCPPSFCPGLRPAMASQFFHKGGQQGHEAFLIGLVETGQGAAVMANANSEQKFQLNVVRAIAKEYGWPQPPSHRAP